MVKAETDTKPIQSAIPKVFAGGGENVPQKTETGGSGRENKLPPKRKKRGGIGIIHGDREVKAYPVTSGELWGLFAVGAGAALCFTVATNLFMFSIEIDKDLALNAGVAKDVVQQWRNTSAKCFDSAIVLLCASVTLIGGGSLKILQIITQTKF